MTKYFMGGEMGAFIPSDNNVTESTFTNSYDSAFSRCSVAITGSGSYAFTPDLGLPDEFYVHFKAVRGSSNSTTQDVLVLRTSTTEVFRVRSNGSQVWMQALISAAWTTVGTTETIPLGSQHFDLYIDGNSATGNAKLYVAGTLRITASSVDLSDVAGIETLRFYGWSNDTAYISQVIVDSEPTIGGRLFTIPITGAGATSSWIGTYTEIDEIVHSDADFINTPTANAVSTFSITAPSLTGYVIEAVAVTARAKEGGSGPTQIQMALRSAGTDYFSSSMALDVGYGGFVNIWETNPATAAAFTTSSIASLQPGVKAIA